MDLEQTAIHEAGHAVVAHALGLSCKALALTHELDKRTGAYGTATGPHPAYGYHGSSSDRRNAVQDECIVCCAGLAAEHVFFDVPLETHNKNAQGDFENIIELERSGELRIRGKRDGHVGDDATWAFIRRKLADAKRLVKRHREEIRLLAEELVAKKRLSEEEVEVFLAEAKD